ncbi:MAG: Slp family lipoprotein [Nitrospiraceae bacterium]
MPITVLPLCLVAAGCTKSPWTAEITQAEEIDRTITFPQLIEMPDSYRGHVVMFGGEVLSAKRLKTGTRVEVLQLPLGDRYEPSPDRMATQGRFFALETKPVDPAALPPGTRVTVVGEASGSTTLPLDEIEYVYPLLTIRQIRVWSPPTEVRYLNQPVYPGYYNFWGPYGRYPWWW